MNAPIPHDILGLAHDTFSMAGHPDHHRIQHITVNPAALAAFLDDVRDIDVQNLEYVPFMRFKLADALENRLGTRFSTTLASVVRNRGQGGFTIGLQGVSSEADDFVKFGTAIAHLLGTSNHDAMSGKYYARFLVKHTDSSDSYLRQAYRLFTMHTDGTYVTEATDWLLMMKFAEENAVGGESRFLHLDDWEEMQDYSGHPLGSKPFLYKSPGSKNVDEVVERPLFFQGEHGLSVCFIDQFVQPSNREEADFLFRLSQSMEASAGTRELGLPVGDLVVLNNYFYLHGRAPFQRNESLHRELMRLRGTFFR